jgi:hypothetical protein
MNRVSRIGTLCQIGLVILLAGCATKTPAGTAAPSPGATLSTAPTPTTSPPVQDVMKLAHFSPLQPGPYFIDPDGDDSTPLRVVYEIPAGGWSQWIGAAKFSSAGHSGLSITTVANLVSHGCSNHSWADPPVGPSVDELVEALSELAPFRVTSPPRDVTIDGYNGKHLEWTVPDLPVDGVGEHGHFTGCTDGDLESWVAFIDTAEPGDAFYGYTGPGYREEFWILDVEGTRLMIAAGRSPGSPTADLAELQAILDSIRIEP